LVAQDNGDYIAGGCNVAADIRDVGAQDPTGKNSPVAWEDSVETQFLRQESPGEPVCYFNNTAYEHGTVVKSGTSILRCDRGIWIEAGPADPDNP
jgi:hypothetical protein